MLLLPLLATTAVIIALAESVTTAQKTNVTPPEILLGHINGEPLTVAQFEQEIRLQHVRKSEQINAWLAGQYQRAGMTFDEAHLAQINGPAGSSELSGVLIEPGN